MSGSASGSAIEGIENVVFGGEAIESVSSASEYDIDKLDKKAQLTRYEQDTQERRLLSHWVILGAVTGTVRRRYATKRKSIFKKAYRY